MESVHLAKVETAVKRWSERRRKREFSFSREFGKRTGPWGHKAKTSSTYLCQTEGRSSDLKVSTSKLPRLGREESSWQRRRSGNRTSFERGIGIQTPKEQLMEDASGKGRRGSVGRSVLSKNTRTSSRRTLVNRGSTSRLNMATGDEVLRVAKECRKSQEEEWGTEAMDCVTEWKQEFFSTEKLRREDCLPSDKDNSVVVLDRASYLKKA